MRKLIIGIIFLAVLFGLTGCTKNYLPDRQEIDDLNLVRVIGIDKSENTPNSVAVTAASKKLTDGGGQSSSDSDKGKGSEGGKALVLTAEGKTIFDAVRNMQTHSDKMIFWGHSSYYLIGEEAAKENLNKYIDFFTRDHELRIEAKVYIVKGTSAKDLIEEVNKGNYYIADQLESLGRNIMLLSTSEEMKMGDLMRLLDMHHSSARIPCIYLTSREGGSNKQSLNMESNGYAIIKDLKLVGFVNSDISRGVNLITNNVGSSVVVVKDPSGQDVSLEILQSKTEVIPHFNGDKLESVTLKTKVRSNITEVNSQMNLFKKDSLKSMASQESEILQSEMEKVIAQVIELQSDCLEICTKISLKSPVKWHKIERQWMDISGKIKYDVQVESTIERTYDIKEPSGQGGRE